jgi:MoaA/NifB/PqqE/SkfB family radical SAM enzyme/SAM-dependent methyltransferase
MEFDPRAWTRLEFEGIPIYLRPEMPDWFVPNDAGDRLLRRLSVEGTTGLVAAERRFLDRLPRSRDRAYAGRHALLRTDSLKELWFHITDGCNMSCSHCLVSSSPKAKGELEAGRILDLARQASALGCRLFALTGGEPFIHGELETIVDGLLDLDGSHVAVLTNGTSIPDRLDDRVHLQISVDGLDGAHDRLRGEGAFARLRRQLAHLESRGLPFTISMCVMKANVEKMADIVDFAADAGAANVHFMWYFVRGRGGEKEFALHSDIFPHLREARDRAAARGIRIDNIDSLRARIFAPPGTIHDGGTSGWESLAVGPDGMLYPSPALVGVEELATRLDGELAQAWRLSPVLQKLRRATVKGDDSPFRFITGGGDPDHSYVHGGEFTGRDPYLPLYEKTALWLITEEAGKRGDEGPPRLRLRMGDLLEQCGEGSEIELVHSNCLLALASRDHVSTVKEFYTRAVEAPKSDILNPVFYPEELVSHIPRENLVRSYGCGSPVLDAGLEEGERVVDLGSGTGVECLIASKLVGELGKVTGIDMLDPMLELASRGASAVADNLGYANVVFKKGYLESLPLESGSADVILSNCVLNLSGDKRSTFEEIRRVLSDGGRLVVSDVVCEEEPPAAIRNDATLKGECIAGALTERDLAGLLEEAGFTSLRVVKKFPYREVRGHPFFSLTFEASLTGEGMEQYFEFVGERRLSEGISCCCGGETKQSVGCMVCGRPLEYFSEEREAACAYCGERQLTTALCEDGHFVCDGCHAEDGLDVIEQICVTTTESDVIALLEKIRSHGSIPMHGPEHHSMVPGIILAAYRNLGGEISDDTIRSGIKRGAQVPGGFCGFAGSCGAATGVGIAFALILGSTPLKGGERAAALQATSAVLDRISRLEAARCCQRESFVSLMTAVELSRTMLPIPLETEATLICRQSKENEECIKALCPVIQHSKPR